MNDMDVHGYRHWQVGNIYLGRRHRGWE